MARRPDTPGARRLRGTEATRRARSLAQAGEDAAAAWLEARGWRILDRNYRVREGEIDIVAARGDTVAFVEVKARSSAAYGLPVEAVTYRKRMRIRGAAVRWLAEHRPRARVIRFDIIDLRAQRGRFALRHIEGAF